MDPSTIKKRIPRKFRGDDEDDAEEETLESMAWESTSSLPTDAVPTPVSSDNEDECDDDSESWTGVRLHSQTPGSSSTKREDEAAKTDHNEGTSSNTKPGHGNTESSEDIPTFLFSRASTALDDGSGRDAATLLLLLIRENEACSRPTQANVHMLLADAYVCTASQTPTKEHLVRKLLFNDAVEALNNAEKALGATKLDRVKIKVKQCTLAIAEGKKEEAERLICVAGILLDKLSDSMKRTSKATSSSLSKEHKTPTRRQLGSAAVLNQENDGEEEKKVEPEELQYLKVEIYTINAMILSDEHDGGHPQAQKELSALVHDPIKLQLMKDILEGFGYELQPDTTMPSRHKIRRTQIKSSKRPRRSPERHSDSLYNNAAALALMLFMVYAFFLMLNIIKLTAEGGLKTIVVFVLASCWSFALYLFLLPYAIPSRNIF